MSNRNLPLTVCLILCFTFILNLNALGQMTLGQYEDEAPLRTWNTFGLPLAQSLGLGGAQFALAEGPSSALTNPALLSKLPKFSVSLSGSLSSASLFRYSIINTGVLSTEKNSTISMYAADFGGVSLKINGWAIAASLSLVEIYDRPKVAWDYTYRGNPYYSIKFTQDGFLKNANFSISRKITHGLAVGIGLNYLFGEYEKTVNEEWIYTQITIADKKSHKYKGFYINGGIVADLTEKLSVAAVFRSPCKKEAQSESSLKYSSPMGDTYITIDAKADNTYSLPLVLGLGMSYRFSSEFRAASDISFFNWSSYSVDYFEEDLARDFRDIVKISAGVEYLSFFQLFGQDVKTPFRFGFQYDPQPMHNPDSYYLYLSFGTGLYWGNFRLDAGANIGKEYGSGNDLSATRMVITIGYQR